MSAIMVEYIWQCDLIEMNRQVDRYAIHFYFLWVWRVEPLAIYSLTNRLETEKCA